MKTSLLHAKLHRPGHATAVIPRLRLFWRLQEGLSCKVTLVSAAAGFGKSTLLSAWLDQLLTQPVPPQAPQAPQGQAQTPVKVSWLTLDETDNQLPRFLRYLIAAIEDSYPQSCQAVTALLQETTDLSIEDVADALVNGLTHLPGRLVLVLDDIHTIDDSAVHAVLARLVQFAPTSFHLVLSARIDPPLPFHRWRAQGQLNELRQRELCFTPEETGAFLEQSLTSPPAAEVVAALHTYTEGWPVGLRLAALALRGHDDPTAFLKEIAAHSHRYAVDYLRDDVLDQQPEALQEFLICTSILKRFCPALCAAVLQIDEATAQQHLRYIEQANLFLVDLSSPPLWYRYHHQFQSMLISKLNERYDQRGIATLYRRAAGWLADNGHIQEALSCVTAIGDFEPAAQLLESQRIALLNEQRLPELAEALALIPAALLNQRPLLLISLAWIHDWRQERAQCVAMIHRVEQLLSDQAGSLAESTRQIIELEIVALRCALDRSPAGLVTLTMIQTSWRRAQTYLDQIHCDVITTLADRCQRLGEAETGQAIMASAMAQTAVWPPVARCRLLTARAIMYLQSANLLDMERNFQASLYLARQHDLAVPATLSEYGLGIIASARHQLDIAEGHYAAALANPYLYNGRIAVLSMHRLIHLYAYQGCPERARPFLERLKEQARLVGLPFLHEQVAAQEAYLDMTCGDLPRALAWVLSGLDAPIHDSSDRTPITRIRILLAEGSAASLDKANQLLSKLIHYLESQHHTYYLSEVLIIQALTWAGLGHMNLALEALGEAAQRLVPNGAIGPFVQQGRPMKQLLRALGQQAGHAPTVELLLAAFPPDAHGDGDGESGNLQPNLTARPLAVDLPEPLTERECEVLRRLAEGLSNKEIARQLVISAHTVRNHTANIFGKLQVDNRVQAVDRARSLGLLPR